MTDPWSEDQPDASTSLSPLRTISSVASPLSASAQVQEGASNVIPSSRLGLDTLSAVAAADSYSFPLPDAAAAQNAMQLPPISPQIPSPSLLSLPPESSHVLLPPRSPAIAAQRNNIDILLQSINPTLRNGNSPLSGSDTPSTPQPSSSIINSTEDEHETAFLMRHYAEVPGYGQANHKTVKNRGL